MSSHKAAMPHANVQPGLLTQEMHLFSSNRQVTICRSVTTLHALATPQLLFNSLILRALKSRHGAWQSNEETGGFLWGVGVTPTRGCGSKICTRNGILVNGNMDQNLRSPGGLI